MNRRAFLKSLAAVAALAALRPAPAAAVDEQTGATYVRVQLVKLAPGKAEMLFPGNDRGNERLRIYFTNVSGRKVTVLIANTEAATVFPRSTLALETSANIVVAKDSPGAIDLQVLQVFAGTAWRDPQ